MKQEIQEGQTKLIQHIQQKLAVLRMQRDMLYSQKYAVSDMKNMIKRPQTINARKATPIQKIELNNNLAKLQQLYQAKKQLRKAGIETNDPAQIYKYNNDPKWADLVERKKKKVAENAQKMKIVNQQMIKAKQFLRSKKVADKQLSELQQMNYRNVLKQKIEQLENYDKLVNKSSLNRIQKQQLITITFSLLKQGSRFPKKDIVRLFLLANPQFCRCFYITHTQINRDLQVFETKEPQMLDQRQFFEFVKSIQITNPNLNPSIKRMSRDKNRKNVIQKMISQKQNKCIKQKQQIKLNDRQQFRKLVDYLRKLFKNFDRSNESIIERIKFLGALQRGMYLNPNTDKNIQVQTLKQLAKFITKKTKSETQKNYYKELQSKYINFVQVQLLCKQFLDSRKPKQVKQQFQALQQHTSAQDNSEQQSQNQQQNDWGTIQEQNQSQLSSQINLSAKQGKQLTQKDFKRYGWNNSQNNQITMQQLDKYYQQIQQKYANQIHWNGYGQQYKANFKQLQDFIKLQDQKYKKLG